ncbi:HEAT repeat domain-containing protein [Spirosoma oryzicola]|uniref:HEAT repeat domain-containing protein n=1 Tax=Spirosoma oryzicola TaxID=2898794 RepID=UPI001E501175|nr:HEAT repeat domain-containing protein [Spirosoma oryzicola]UHG89282.1 HEAT repeat domain-containing protein [Spirosoma oryzicola]
MKLDIEALLKKYYEGETTVAEENQLRQFFQQENVPEHLRSHTAQFRYFAEARKQQPSAASTTQLAAKLDTPPLGRVRSLTSWTMRIAAGVTLLLVGFASGRLYDRRLWDRAGTEAAYGESSDEAPARDIKKVLAFGQTPSTSASERIQAVNQSYELAQVDRDITQLLINTLNFDANVNVRLAACQALIRFENEPGVREALIQSLKIQNDPNVQLTLIDALVAIKEKRAVNEMQRLAQNQHVLDIVRTKAAESINRLNQTGHSPS